MGHTHAHRGVADSASASSAGEASEGRRDAPVGASASFSSLLVFVVLFGIYFATATRVPLVSVDVLSATAPAWRVVEQGTLDLTGYSPWVLDTMERNNQLVEVDGASYSGRNPGVIAFGVPFYAVATLTPEAQELPMWPGALAGALAAAATGAVLNALFRRLTTSTAAAVAALFFGLGTGTWAISADGLWGHGPAQLLLALGVLAMATDRLVTSGLAYGMAITMRPYSGFAAAATGLHRAWVDRDVRPAVRIGLASSLGLAAFVIYTRFLFGVWSVFGGYSQRGYLQENVVEGQGFLDFPVDVFWALVHPSQGLFVYAPFLLVLVLGLPAAWRVAPTWARSAFLGGLAFFAAQLYANTWNAGTFFFGYRYPLEFLTMSAPMWLLAWREGVRGNRGRTFLFVLAAVIAVALQFIGGAIEPYKEGFAI